MVRRFRGWLKPHGHVEAFVALLEEAVLIEGADIGVAEVAQVSVEIKGRCSRSLRLFPGIHSANARTAFSA